MGWVYSELVWWRFCLPICCEKGLCQVDSGFVFSVTGHALPLVHRMMALVGSDPLRIPVLANKLVLLLEKTVVWSVSSGIHASILWPVLVPGLRMVVSYPSMNLAMESHHALL
jgi:hypothetical protein